MPQELNIKLVHGEMMYLPPEYSCNKTTPSKERNCTQLVKMIKVITSDALKIEPNRICPCAFIMTFWQFFFILQNSQENTFKKL